MKTNNYISPEFEVLSIEDKDIITTSDPTLGTKTTVVEDTTGGSWEVL